MPWQSPEEEGCSAPGGVRKRERRRSHREEHLPGHPPVTHPHLPTVTTQQFIQTRMDSRGHSSHDPVTSHLSISASRQEPLGMPRSETITRGQVNPCSAGSLSSRPEGRQSTVVGELLSSWGMGSTERRKGWGQDSPGVLPPRPSGPFSSPWTNVLMRFLLTNHLPWPPADPTARGPGL